MIRGAIGFSPATSLRRASSPRSSANILNALRYGDRKAVETALDNLVFVRKPP